MKYIDDGQGNRIIDPESEAILLAESASEEVPEKTRKERLSDFILAEQAVVEWGKPVAFHAGELWSFTIEKGWEVVTDRVLALCNKLRGQETSRTVFSILCNQLKTPDMAQVQETSTYWKRVGGIWEGEWIPFPVTSHQVVFANGVLDLSTNKFRVVKEQVIFGPRVTIPYTGMAESCPEFEEMLERALPDDEVREYFQKLCSLILQPDQILRSQIVLWGVPHSGKTTIATAIACAPAGLVGASFMDEDKIVRDKFASTPLINKFANVSNDSAFTKKWESWMKSYTSGTVVVEPKFHKPTSLPTTAKLISTCNEMQKMSDPSGASEQRYRVFEFRVPVEDTGSTDQTSKMKPSYWCEPSRRAGIIGWLLRGLKKALLEGITEPDCMKKSKRDAISESDPLFGWVMDELKLDKEGFITTKDIQERLPEELSDKSAQHISPMVDRVWGIKNTRYKGKRGFKGLGFKE